MPEWNEVLDELYACTYSISGLTTVLQTEQRLTEQHLEWLQTELHMMKELEAKISKAVYNV